jgi:hypothetical protein
MILVAMADGIIKVETVIGESHFRGPKVAAQGRIGPEHGAARRLPLDEIGGLEEGKYLANRFTGGFELPGANRIIRFAVFPNEWISEVGTVGRV